MRGEKDRQDNETFILQRSLEELSSRLEAQQQAIRAKDETIAQLMEMIQSNKGLESKQLEMHKEQHSTDKKKLSEALNQLAKLREGIDERDRAIASLQEVIKALGEGDSALNMKKNYLKVSLFTKEFLRKFHCRNRTCTEIVVKLCILTVSLIGT